jgi:hypothetical protein
MAITASQARALTTANRLADLENIYTGIETEAGAGNSVLLVDSVLNYDTKAALTSSGYSVTNPTDTSTLISWEAPATI